MRSLFLAGGLALLGGAALANLIQAPQGTTPPPSAASVCQSSVVDDGTRGPILIDTGSGPMFVSGVPGC